jgi:hypothetical protein
MLVDKALAQAKLGTELDRRWIEDKEEYRKAKTLFEVGGDPKEIMRLLVKAVKCK